MKKIAWIILGIAIYFIGGWIAKDIVFSVIKITEETTLKDITDYELYIYSAISILFSFIASGYKQQQNDDDPIMQGSLIMFILLLLLGFVKIMPISMGIVALYNIINISAIIYAICTNKYIK